MGNWPLLDFNQNILQDKDVNFNWYQKPSDTGTRLNARSSAPIQYKRSVIQGFAQRAFRSISNWEQVYNAKETKRLQRLKNQCPEKWSANIAADGLCKIIVCKGKPLDNERSSSIQPPKYVKPPLLMVQFRGNQIKYFASRLQNLTSVQVVFTTRKLESCLLSLMSTFSNYRKSRVAYNMSCSGCTPTYIGQTVR